MINELYNKEFKPSFDELISYFNIPELQILKDIKQDDVWHNEGNVAIHTSMVIQEVYNLDIEGKDRCILVISALFHDVGKIFNTKLKVINGKERTVSPGHEIDGSNFLLYKLPEYILNNDILYTVLDIIRTHNLPKLLAIKESDKSEYIKLSLSVNTRLVYLFEIADMKGRICPDLDEQLMYLDYFKEKCIEYDLWGKKYVPKLNLNNLNYKEQLYLKHKCLFHLMNKSIFIDEEVLGKEYINKQNYATLILMCGVAGSGKSTTIESIKYDAIISLDEIRKEVIKFPKAKQSGMVLQIAKKRLKIGLANKEIVIYDATNYRKDFRSKIISIGNDYNALTKIIFIHKDVNTILHQNSNRLDSVPNSVIYNQIDKFQFPTYEEANIIEIVS